MEKNSGVLANTLYRILRYKGSTIYRALTVFKERESDFKEYNSIIERSLFL
jgi:hypothetical protein